MLTSQGMHVSVLQEACHGQEESSNCIHAMSVETAVMQVPYNNNAGAADAYERHPADVANWLLSDSRD